MHELIDLGPLDLVIAAGLVLVAGLVSLALRLDLERKLALASARTVVQLLVVGYVLKWVFAVPWRLVPLVTVMIGVAAHTAVARSSRTFRGARWRAFVTLVGAGLITVSIVTGAIVRVEPWYTPQYLVPLLGMILGNSLTGISLCLDHMLEVLDQRRGEVEMELAHGATRWEAARGPMREALRRGMIPIINSMMVVGVVSLPGMMTGQILAGSEPDKAVRYQIVVMFMIAAAVAMGAMGMALWVYRRLFNERHQLRIERVWRRG